MKWLDSLALAFINFFGITQPTDKTRRRATWFILGMTLLALVMVALVGGVFWRVLQR